MYLTIKLETIDLQSTKQVKVGTITVMFEYTPSVTFVLSRISKEEWEEKIYIKVTNQSNKVKLLSLILDQKPNSNLKTQLKYTQTP